MSGNPFNLLSGLSKSPTDQRSSPSAPAASQSQARPEAPTSQPGQQAQGSTRPGKKRKNHRGGKKKRQRRKSFAIIDDDDENSQAGTGGTSGEALYQIPSANLSGASIDSEALLDHRCVELRELGLVAGPWANQQQRPSADAHAAIVDRRRGCWVTFFSIHSCNQRRWPTTIFAQPTIC